MVTRITKLTPEQEARIPEWRDRWINIGLSTKPADRPTFEDAVARCYQAARLTPPKRIVWVASPLVMALAAPVASLILRLRAGQPRAVHDAVDGAVHDAVHDAVDGAVHDAVHGAVHDAVDGAVHDAVDGAVHGAVDGAVGDAVHGAVDGAVGDAVHDAVHDAVDGAVHGAVDDAVHGAVGDAVHGAVHGAVDGAVGDAVHGAVHDAVDGAVHGAVDGAVALRRAVANVISRAWYLVIGGQFWVGGWYWGSPSYVSFFRDVCGLDLGDEMNASAKAYADTASSACWWWPHREFVMVCERPRVIARDDRGRLHNEHGAAVEFRDGWGVHAWHGVRVPAAIIEHPDAITVAQIDAEANAEIRRVMIERYGQARYLIDSGAKEIARDDCGTLYRKDIPGDEPLVMVRVLNSTPEPDGTLTRAEALASFAKNVPVMRGDGMTTLERCHRADRFKSYFLRVPPDIATAREAVAWTFDIPADEYTPLIQS